MRSQPLIAVQDVEASSRWYQRLLGCRSGHGGPEYEQLVDQDGTMILQLHAWDAHEHPHLGDPRARPLGNGVLLWFQIGDFSATLARAGCRRRSSRARGSIPTRDIRRSGFATPTATSSFSPARTATCDGSARATAASSVPRWPTGASPCWLCTTPRPSGSVMSCART